MFIDKETTPLFGDFVTFLPPVTKQHWCRYQHDNKDGEGDESRRKKMSPLKIRRERFPSHTKKQLNRCGPFLLLVRTYRQTMYTIRYYYSDRIIAARIISFRYDNNNRGHGYQLMSCVISRPFVYLTRRSFINMESSRGHVIVLSDQQRRRRHFAALGVVVAAGVRGSVVGETDSGYCSSSKRF
mmetsp:Transcript_6317/g.7953  ORF Transcript_6317/g.7953 Transcript_6317/m.7953 type:complete len:184 (-) Transcript_6317:122-673(-)